MKLTSPRPLIDLFHDAVSRAIDSRGVYPHQVLSADADGKVTMTALAVDRPFQVMAYVAGLIRSGEAVVLVYAMDRFTKPGQGTTLGDCLAGAHFASCEWRPFVIEYQHEPQIVKPTEFANDFWNTAIARELTQFGILRKAGGA